jgi:hypothetical protein
MIEFILGRKALYACHRDEALRRLTLVEQGAEQEQTPRGDPHTTRPGREGSAPVSQHIFHCKHGTSASAPIPRVVTWKRGVCLHSDESNASRVDCAGIPNEPNPIFEHLPPAPAARDAKRTQSRIRTLGAASGLYLAAGVTGTRGSGRRYGGIKPGCGSWEDRRSNSTCAALETAIARLAIAGR